MNPNEAKSPVAFLLDSVEWEEIDVTPEPGLPYATHKGVLEVAGMRLRCYTLNDGRRVFDGDDVRAMFRLIPK